MIQAAGAALLTPPSTDNSALPSPAVTERRELRAETSTETFELNRRATAVGHAPRTERRAFSRRRDRKARANRRRSYEQGNAKFAVFFEINICLV